MSSARILMIWNDRDLIKMFTIFFEQYGYIVHSADSLETGFAASLHQPPDILIVPRTFSNQGDGLEFCQRIRTTSTLSHIPIIVGYANLVPEWLKRDDAYQQVHETGANACFGHPFDITDVLKEVETLLANPTATHLIDR
jgi:CheY-like chemotaxis protein